MRPRLCLQAQYGARDGRADADNMEHTMKVSKVISQSLAGAGVIAVMIAAALPLTDGARARDLRAPGPMIGPPLTLLQSTAILAKSAPNNPVHGPAPGTTSNPHDPCFPANCSSLRRLENEIAYFSAPNSTVL